jgi:hypothetical protein
MILLQLSAATLLLPVAYFLLNTRTKTAKQYALATALIAVFTSSQIFWRNPVKNSTMHRIDAFIAKTTVVGFIAYTLAYSLCKITLVIPYAAVMVAIGTAAFVGHQYSSKTWCSSEHVYSHALLHVIGAIGATYAFL